MKGRFVILGLAVLLLAQLAAAAAFTARMSRDGDEVQVTYTLKEAKGQAGEPRFPDFKGLKRLSGPAVGTSMSIVNGAVSQEKTWSFSFLATSDQPVRVAPATIVVDGRTLSSESLTVPGRAQDKGGDDRPARLVLEAEPRRPVVGQAVRLRLRLDFNVNVRGYDAPQLPTAPGFVVESLDRPQQPEVGSRTVGGRTWQTAVLAEWLLFPVREGRLRLEPLAMTLQVEERQGRRGRDPFDLFGGSLFNRLKTLSLSTEPLVFEVAPLPAGAPPGYRGAVGRFSLAAAPDRVALKAGEAVTMTVTIEGTGYLAGVEAPPLTHSPDLERYDTQEESSVKAGPEGQKGRRRFKTLLVPRLPGEQRIDALGFAWYDPVAGAYRSATAGPWVLTVAPGAGGVASVGVPAAAGGRVQTYGQDIRQPLPVPERLLLRRAPPHHRWPWLAGMALTVLVVPAAAAGAAWRDKRRREAPALRVRGALRRARRRLAAGAGQAAAQEEALRGYLADRLGRAAPGLLLEDCRRELAFRGAPAVLVESLEQVWRRAEFARYAGEAPLPVAEVEGLLSALERWFAGGARP